MAEVIRLELRKGSYQMAGDTLPYETQAAAIAAVLAANGYGNVREAIVASGSRFISVAAQAVRGSYCDDPEELQSRLLNIGIAIRNLVDDDRKTYRRPE